MDVATNEISWQMMDLQYFLEMVDLKHRYGSNLRTYHEEWKKADTKEVRKVILLLSFSREELPANRYLCRTSFTG